MKKLGISIDISYNIKGEDRGSYARSVGRVRAPLTGGVWIRMTTSGTEAGTGKIYNCEAVAREIAS